LTDPPARRDAAPLLETGRLLLRPMTPDDLDALLRIFTDPNVMAAFDTPLFDRDQMRRWLQRNLDHQTEHGYGLCALISKETGELIGDCGLEHLLLDGVSQAELGYDLRSDHWRCGLATEAACAMRDYAFGQLKLPRLISLIRQGNHASRRVAEKVGMRLERELTQHGVEYWVYSMEAKRHG
jgi:[ribosomal protein S5]-alanine N-acetyltransferase